VLDTLPYYIYYELLVQPNFFYCLELSKKQLIQAPNADAVKFLMIVVHVLLPGTARTFQDYADTVFVSYYVDLYIMPKELTVFGMCIY